MLLQRIGLAGLVPQPSDVEFLGWWRDKTNFISSSFQDGLNSLVILGAWTLWRHRNDCVFNGVRPNISTMMIMLGNEIRILEMAGAKGLSFPSVHG
jgi:hypothetical protein